MLARRWAGAALLVSAAVNLAAALLMRLVLAEALPAGSTEAGRLAYVAAHREAVVASWGVWVAATVTLLLALWALASALDAARHPYLPFAFALACVGASLDIAADVIQMSALPALAELSADPDPSASAAARASFRAWEAAAVALTGGAGNTLYALAGTLYAVAAFRTAWFPRWLAWWGAAVWAAAWTASAALIWAPAFLPLTVGTTMVMYVSWAAATGLSLLRGHGEPAPLRRPD